MSDHGQNGPVVMVDDADDDAFIARTCFRRAGLAAEFLHLPSGEALLDHLSDVLAGRTVTPSIVLLDINMPGLNGFETLKRVRSMPEFHDAPPVAMLTNSDDPEDARRAREEGASEFVTKPDNLQTYVTLFRRLLSA